MPQRKLYSERRNSQRLRQKFRASQRAVIVSPGQESNGLRTPEGFPFMPKVKPAVIPTKKPLPLVKPILPVLLAVIPPLKPGVVAKNLTGKLSRPNPVVRRGKR